jgi:hypothetical protein
VQNSFSLLSNHHTLSTVDSQPLPMVSESVIASRPQFVVLIILLIFNYRVLGFTALGMTVVKLMLI